MAYALQPAGYTHGLSASPQHRSSESAIVYIRYLIIIIEVFMVLTRRVRCVSFAIDKRGRLTFL